MAASASSIQAVNSCSTATITQVSDAPLTQTQTHAPAKELTLCPAHLPDPSKPTDVSITYCPNLAHSPDVSKIWENIREYVLQVGGISMGTEFTPSYANTCMTGFEESALKK